MASHMSPGDIRGATEGGTALAPFGMVMDMMSEAFEDVGTAGLVLIDGAPLEEIELNYGSEAYQKVMDDLTMMVRDVVGDQMRGQDSILTGEYGSNEIIILLFRPRSDPYFFSEVLPRIARGLEAAFEKIRSRILHPYYGTIKRLPVSFSASLYNPILRGERQLFRLLEQARQESRLGSKLGARQRRNALTKLVLAGDVTMVYQPIFDLRTEEVFGYEALVRPHHTSGISCADDLFATAKEAGLLFDLDNLCRHHGLENARELPFGTKLFLNCLPMAIHDPSFRGDQLTRLLDSIELAPEDLVLEISERESIDNFTIFREARDYYAKLGIRVALDDTGAGYASLRAVMELAPDYIKLDHFLVHSIEEDPPRQELLVALEAVAKKIGSQIIAEGIETAAEYEVVKSLGIVYGQGFYMARPDAFPKPPIDS